MEDVKTLGTRPKRLRELLRFIERGWAELRDEEPGWLITAEEIGVYEFLMGEMSYLGATFPSQLSNYATKALRLDASLLADFRRTHVVVINHHGLSRASQMLCQLVARDSLTVLADPEGCERSYEDYPNPGGLDELKRLNPTVVTANLDSRTQGHEGRGEDDQASSVRPVRRRIEAPTPQDEIGAVADLIDSQVALGEKPGEIGVIATHPRWARGISKALASRNVPFNLWYGPLALRGDIRDISLCHLLRAVTFLRLVADPENQLAWRCWFGFGDYLARSSVFTKARTGSATKEGVLGDVRTDLAARGVRLGVELDDVLKRAASLRGEELIALAWETVGGEGGPDPLLSALVADDQTGAEEMAARLDDRQYFSGIPHRDAVTVSSIDAAAGLGFKSMYVVGFEDGLFPGTSYFDLTQVSIDRQKTMGRRDERTARVISHMGEDLVCVSGFRQIEHDLAERVGVRQARIFSGEGGVLMAEAEPSMYTGILLGRS